MSPRTNNSYTTHIDWLTVVLYFLLVGFGWMNLYAANFNPEKNIFFAVDTEYFRQMIWIGISAICIILILLVDSKLFVEFGYLIFGISIFLILLTFVIGKEVNGAKAWIAFGPVQLQPVEFTKIGTALVLAHIMSRHDFSFNIRNYFRLAIVLLIPITLVLLQNDTGCALIFFVFLLPMFREGMTGHILVLGVLCIIAAISSLLVESEWVMATILALGMMINLIIFFRSGAKRETFIALAILILSLIFTAIAFSFFLEEIIPEYVILISSTITSIYLIITILIKRIYPVLMILMYMWIGILTAFATGYVFENILQDHQRTRINILFGIEDDPLGAGYNVNQSLIAIGSGGFSGKGFMEGTQTKLNFVPKQTTDFIFCTVGEEWGFLGSMVLVALYLTFFLRIIALAEKQHSVFSRVFGYCVASIFFFHFTVNICMAIGLMPVIGIPLPFFSYGGSSLWGFSMMLFIFLKLDTNRNDLIR